MRIEGIAGPQVLTDGTISTPRLERLGGIVVSENLPRYAESVYRGNVYTAANQSGKAMPTALAAASTGWILSNPAGSGVNLVLLEMIYAFTAVPGSGSTIVLAAQTNTIITATVHTTPLVVRKALIGASGVGAGLVDDTATLGATPVVIRAVGGPAATGATTPPYIKDEIAGAVILVPGTSVATFSLTGIATAVVSGTWMEVAI